MKVVDWDGLVALVEEIYEKLKNRVPITRTVNSKPLAENITLDAKDVGAISGVQKNGVDLETDDEGKVNVEVPEKMSELINDKGYITESGDIATAEKLATPRTIGISLGVTGIPTEFDGSEDITIPATSVNTDFLKNGENTLIIYCGNASEPGPFAVYSETDNSLIFYNGNIPSVGENYNGRVATDVYTGFETEEYSSASSVPWYSIRESVKSVTFDGSFAGVQPIAMGYWFSEFTNLAKVDAAYLDTSKVTTLYNTFYNCSSLTKLDGLSNWNTSKVTEMCYMFRFCESLTSLDVSNFDTSNVTDMAYMFQHCESLTSLDVSNFDTSKVTNMAQMFSYLHSITYLDLSNFNTSNVTAMNGMFRVDDTTYTSGIEVLDLRGWDTSKVTAMNAMFRDNHGLKTIYADKDWNTSSVTNDANMFLECTSLVGGNGTAYSGSNVDSTMAHIDIADNPGYFTQI